MNHRYVRARIGAIICGAVTAISALALDPAKGITQFAHRSWNATQGVGEVYSIAQTSEGYLWIATSNGTFRFDGKNFSPLETDTREPVRLGMTPYQVTGSRDGSLWIDCGDKVLRIRNGKQTVYSEKNGLPGGPVQSLREEKDGSIWVTGLSGFSRFAEERWQKFGIEGMELVVPPSTTLLDSNQNVWSVVFDRSRGRFVAVVLRPGMTAFRSADDASRATKPYVKALREDQNDTTKMAEAPDGKIWTAQRYRLAVRGFIPDQTGLSYGGGGIDLVSRDILFDRDGGLWIATLGKGVHRVRDTATLPSVEASKAIAAADKFTQDDGLSSDYAMCIFEDRDGGIWVGTSGGLDYFGESKFTTISSREGLPPGQGLLVQPAGNIGVWVGSTNGFARIEYAGPKVTNHAFFKLKDDDQPVETLESVLCVYSDPQGGLLAGTSAGVMAFQNDGTAATFLTGANHRIDGRQGRPPERGDLTHVWTMTRDQEGSLWLFDEGHGAFRLRGEELQQVPLAGIDSSHVVTTCHTDRAGRVWMAIYSRKDGTGSLACYDAGKLQGYSQGDGLFTGKIQCILSDAQGRIWVAGQGGLSKFEHGRFQTLTRQNGLPDDNLFSVLEDNDGDFWLTGRSGIFRIGARDLDHALTANSGTVANEFFEQNDGLRGFVGDLIGLGGLGGRVIATKSFDGRLWIPTSAGLTTIDPRQILRNKTPPPVHIQKIVAGGKSYGPAESLALPAGTRDCEFDYIGLCFADPSKVRYRYKLEGYDEQWVEAGTRSQAFYSNLKPGSYRFRVIACNNDGVWNETGSAAAFSITPAFHQRAWFPIVYVLPIALALWSLHRLRMAQQAARANLRLELQAVERQRIARELHDTLLQGFIGVGLKLEAIATGLPESLSPVRDQLRKVLDQSDQYLTEARHSVMELRSASLDRSDDLSHALVGASKRLTDGTGIQLVNSVDGSPLKLPAQLESNLLRIGEEAVSNAVRHARPTRVELTLKFGRKELSLRIRDNGSGFDPHGPAATKAGHFGLVGMHERVKGLGGRLIVTSQPGKGTEIVVTVPIKRDPARRWFKNFF